MQTLVEQWPLLGGFVVIAGGLLRVIQAQYEARIRELRDEVELWRDLALSGTSIAERMTGVVERTARARQP